MSFLIWIEKANVAMWRERSIIHFNVANFGVAVERAADSSLRKKPLIIAPLQTPRAIVYDMSEEAFQCGVRKGMQLFQATKRCPEAVVIGPRFELYQRAMCDFFKRVGRFSPLIEQGVGDGHFFVDVTGTHRLFGPAPDIGWRVRKDVRGDLGINPIWTVSPSKLVAKVASRVVKPVGECIVAAGEEERFLAPLSVLLLPGTTLQERRRLDEFNISRVGQLASLTKKELMVIFGTRCDFFYESSRGIDIQPVKSGMREDEKVSHEHHFANDTNDSDEVRTALFKMVTKAGMELRQRNRVARRVGVKLIYSDGISIVRQGSKRLGANNDFILRDLALQALKRAWIRRTRLRSCFLSCDRLHRPSRQLSLFPEVKQAQKKTTLFKAVDKIRSRFGDDLVRVGCS